MGFLVTLLKDLLTLAAKAATPIRGISHLSGAVPAGLISHSDGLFSHPRYKNEARTGVRKSRLRPGFPRAFRPGVRGLKFIMNYYAFNVFVVRFVERLRYFFNF